MRQQRESKRMYDQLILAPMDAYNEAMRLYLAGKYWEASYAFGKVISLNPSFHRVTKSATFYMGNCYRYLQMNGIAREVYKGAFGGIYDVGHAAEVFVWVGEHRLPRGEI